MIGARWMRRPARCDGVAVVWASCVTCFGHAGHLARGGSWHASPIACEAGRSIKVIVRHAPSCDTLGAASARLRCFPRHFASVPFAPPHSGLLWYVHSDLGLPCVVVPPSIRLPACALALLSVPGLRPGLTSALCLPAPSLSLSCSARPHSPLSLHHSSPSDSTHISTPPPALEDLRVVAHSRDQFDSDSADAWQKARRGAAPPCPMLHLDHEPPPQRLQSHGTNWVRGSAPRPSGTWYRHEHYL